MMNPRRQWKKARDRWRRVKRQSARFKGLESVVEDAREEMRMWAGAAIYERNWKRELKSF